MNLTGKLSQYYIHPSHSLKLNYAQLVSAGLDIGFTSTTKNNRDFHQITRDICLSVMKFHSGKLSNLVFSNGQSIRLELEDAELVSYYSDYIELRYILFGNLEVEIEGTTAHFHENEICFIDSMAYHRESIKDSECILLNISIRRSVFNETFLENVNVTPLQKFLRTNIMKLGEQQHFIKFIPESNVLCQKIQSYIFHILSEVKDQKTGYLDISRGYVLRLMDALSADCKYNLSRCDPNMYRQKLFESVSEYMQNNLASATMNDLVNKFHFQPNYFNRLIKKNTGITYSEFLIKLRIEQAKRLLETTNLSIEEIMWLVGYNNKGFFYKKFREATGLTPSRYRSNSDTSRLSRDN